MKLPYGLIYLIAFIGLLMYEVGQFSFERCIAINMPLFVALCALICAFGLTFIWHQSNDLYA